MPSKLKIPKSPLLTEKQINANDEGRLLCGVTSDYHKLTAIISSPSLKEINRYLSQGKRIIFDDEDGHFFPFFEIIKEEERSFDFLVCLKNKNFYQLDFIAILETYLCKTACHPLIIEQIITAAQEAYANAFMWSSLDLSSHKDIRPYEFFEQIQGRLQDSFYGNRKMLFYLKQLSSEIEISIYIQGYPIIWPENHSSHNFRGIEIIKTFCHRVFIEENGQGIRLFFKI